MKVAIYTRLSEEDRNKANSQTDSESIQNQKDMLVKYSVEHGWGLYDIYNDDDYRGSDRERPQFIRLLQDAEAGKFQIVLCKSQSRFTRELELVEKLIHGRFVELGIRFIGLVDNADTDVKGNKKSRQINGLVNEWYLEDLSESVSAALDIKRQRGDHIGAFALYGYAKSPEQKGKLIIDEVAASTVRKIYCMYDEGNGLVCIAKALNDAGIPNPTWYKAQNGLKTRTKSRARMSSAWSINTVRSILRNRIYAGDLVQGRFERVSYKSKKIRCIPKDHWVVVEGTHEPIIDRETWMATQARLKQRSKAQKDGTVHLFAGKVFCMECGSSMHANHARGIKYLRCPTGEVSKTHCSGCGVQLKLIEEQVLQKINALIEAYTNEQELGERVVLSDSAEAELSALTRERAFQEKPLADFKKAMLSLYLDKAKGVLTEDTFLTLAQELAAQRESHEKRLSAIDEQIAALNKKLQARLTKAEILAKYKHFNELNRELVDGFIERIEVGKRNQDTRLRQIKIVWKV